MKDKLYDYLVGQNGAVSPENVFVIFLAAVIVASVIFISYRFSHASSVYSAKFNVSLVMITLVTTLVMSVINNNLALSLGMVGALSIVRFRTAIKDSRDTVYIFWAVAAGICCGAQDYLVVAVGSGVIFVVMMLIGNVRNNDRYLIVVRGVCVSTEVTDAIDRFYRDKAIFRVDNSDREHMEVIFEVSESTIKKANKKNDKTIKDVLFDIDGIEAVNLICQNDEISR